MLFLTKHKTHVDVDTNLSCSDIAEHLFEKGFTVSWKLQEQPSLVQEKQISLGSNVMKIFGIMEEHNSTKIYNIIRHFNAEMLRITSLNEGEI